MKVYVTVKAEHKPNDSCYQRSIRMQMKQSMDRLSA